MKKYKAGILHKIFSLLLTGSLIFTAFPTQTVRAEETAAEETVAIGSMDEFLAFARACVDDSYSLDRTFVLTADLDFTDTAFQPVPVMSGTFYGNGHKITGVKLTDTGSDIGVFRFIEQSGTVTGLTVEGEIAPSGSKSRIGGIAGTNKGLIAGCRTGGKVKGKEMVGGIAGFNAKTGRIEACANAAAVSGSLNTGGIAGKNEGDVYDSVNSGSVNITVEEQEESRDNAEAAQSKVSGETALLEIEKVNNTGGVAGSSSGMIQNCSNFATIGYDHAGYNTGGIAGIQNGCIRECRNYGTVLGRKDVGGIVGQFEPFIEISYKEDAIQQANRQLGSLSELVTGLGDIAGDAGSGALDSMEEIQGSIEGIQGAGGQAKEEFMGLNDRFFDNLQEHKNAITSQFDSLLPESETDEIIKSYLDEIKAHIQRLGKLMDQLKETKDKNIISKIKKELKAIAGQCDAMLEGVLADVNEDTSVLKQNIKALRNQVNALDAMLGGSRSDLRGQMRETDADFVERTEVLTAQINRLQSVMRNTNDRIRNQMNAITNQMNAINYTITDGIQKLEEGIDLNFMEDISDQDVFEPARGRIIQCINEGDVSSDNNTGGIAGIIAVEASADPEKDIETTGSKSLNINKTACASIGGSVNRGSVVSRNDYAGGIAGRADLGALVSNENYAGVEAAGGDYTGGIAGKSMGAVHDNYVLCTLRGNSYVGGIAGYAKTLWDNYSLAQILSGQGEKLGAVAGYVEEQAFGNYFVREETAAVDGVNYSAQAAPLSYEEFTSLEGIPEAFLSLRVTFKADGKVVKKMEVPYGGTLTGAQIPQAPSKEGYYTAWEEEDFSSIKQNLTVEAVYEPWTTTIASESDAEKPMLLLEGEFHPKTRPIIQEEESRADVKGYKVLHAYEFHLTAGEEKNSSMKRVRILAEDASDRTVAAVAEEDGLRLVPTQREGSYLVFSMEEPGTFVLLEKKQGIFYLAAAIGALLIAAAVILCRIIKPCVKNKRHTGFFLHHVL